MRKLFYLLLLIIPLSTFSQKNENETESFKEKNKLFKGYVVAGFNLTQIDGDGSANYNNIGLNVGGGVFLNYTDKFSNSFEINYSMKGARSGLNLKKSHPNYFWYQMDYIEIPLMFNYHDFKIAIFQIGLSYSNIIRSNFQSSFTTINPNDPNYPSFYTSNLDIVVGVTFLLKKHWGINFKYNYSLLNNLKNGDVRGNLISQPAGQSSNSSSFLNWYHNVLTFRAMYVF